MKRFNQPKEKWALDSFGESLKFMIKHEPVSMLCAIIFILIVVLVHFLPTGPV